MRSPFALEQLPFFLTISEAAEMLRIGRSTAYELAERFEATGGAVGLAVVRLGRQLRVPRSALIELMTVTLSADSAASRATGSGRDGHGAA